MAQCVGDLGLIPGLGNALEEEMAVFLPEEFSQRVRHD